MSKIQKFDRFVLSNQPTSFVRTSQFVVVCEGLADANFISALLVHKSITDYQVGCPSTLVGGGQGKDRIEKYLQSLAANPKGLKGLLVIVDADTDPKRIFKQMVKAFQSVAPWLPIPKSAFKIEGDDPRSAIFLMPNKGRRGTLEHLFLDAAYNGKPKLKGCLDKFEQCVGKVKGWPPNKKAKMRATTLTAVHCKDNPACSIAWVWAQKGNPIPIDSKAFDHISDFLTKFKE